MMRRILVLSLALAGLTACNPYLQQQSVAPPGRSARLDEVTGFWGSLKRYRLEISQGVAVALTCNEGGPCAHMKVVSDNPAIAEVRSASLSRLDAVGYGTTSSMSQPAAAFVLIGKAPGQTRVHVVADEGKRDVVITVIAPPATAPLVTAGPG